MPSVEVNLPNVPEGATVSVPYLGKFKNGETVEVDEKNWGRYLRNQPGAVDPEGGTLKLTREAMSEANADLEETQEGTEPPVGEDPTEHSPQQTEGDNLSKDVESKLDDLNKEG